MPSPSSEEASRKSRSGDLIVPPAMRPNKQVDKLNRKGPPGGPVPWWGYLSLLLLSLIVFAPIFKSDLLWTEYDGVPRSGFSSMDEWTEAWTMESIRTDDPLTLCSYFFEQQLPLPQPPLHYAINLILHLLVAVILLKLLESLEMPGAFVAALTFAIHPTVVPTIFWSGYRDIIAATAVALAALYFSTRNRNILDFIALLGLSAAAFVMHRGTLVLPLVMALIILYQQRKFQFADYNRLLPIAFLALVFALIFKVSPETRELAAEDRLLEIGSQNVFFFIQQSLFPSDPALFHPFSEADRYRVGATSEILPFAFFLPFYILIFVNLHKQWARGFLLGLTALLLFVLHGIFRVGQFIDGEPAKEAQVLYMALPFVVALVACGLGSIFYAKGPPGKFLWKIVVGVLLLVQISLTGSFTLALGNESRLWRDMASRWPSSWEPKSAYLDSLKLEDGYALPPERVIELHLETLKLNPELHEKRHDLLDLYLAERQPSNALREYRRLLRETEPSDLFLAEAADFFDKIGLSWEARNARERLSSDPSTGSQN